MLKDFKDDIESDTELQLAAKSSEWRGRALEPLRNLDKNPIAKSPMKMHRVAAHDFIMALDNQFATVTGGGMARYQDTSWELLGDAESKYHVQPDLYPDVHPVLVCNSDQGSVDMSAFQ